MLASGRAIKIISHPGSSGDRRRISRSRRLILFLVTASASLGYGLSTFLKDFFVIPRPCLGLDMCPSDFSMPSSHTTIAFSAMGTLGFLTTPWVLLLAVVEAISRVFEGFHTWEDVVVGAFLGLLVSIVVY